MCRKQAELEELLIEEEVARRVKEQIEERVRAAMSSDAVQQSLQMRLEAERKVLEEQVSTSSYHLKHLQACIMWFSGFATVLRLFWVLVKDRELSEWSSTDVGC